MLITCLCQAKAAGAQQAKQKEVEAATLSKTVAAKAVAAKAEAAKAEAAKAEAAKKSKPKQMSQVEQAMAAARARGFEKAMTAAATEVTVSSDTPSAVVRSDALSALSGRECYPVSCF